MSAIPAGYRQTEVGMIPEDWGVDRLADLSDRIMVGIASAATHAYREKGIPLLRNQNIKPGYLDDSDVLHVDPGYELAFQNKRLRAGDLLTARTGYPGTTCVIPEAFDAAQSFTTLITRPRASVIESGYLCHYINSEHGQRFFEQTQIGGAQKNVNAGTLREMPIPVPPLPEQRAIATALSDVDALLAKLDQLISKKRDIKQAAMQQLLTGQTRLPGFGGAWEVKRLRDVAELSPGINKPVSSMGSGVLYVTVQDLYKGTSIPVDQLGRIQVSPAELQSHRLAIGDIVFGKSSVKREGIGYPSIYLGATEPAVCTGFSYRVRAFPTAVDARFLFYALRWEPTRRWVIDNSQASALTNLNKSIADSIPIPMPPLPEQTAIATVLSDMDAELAALEARRDKTRTLKQGMMQELLTGRIRLVKPEKVDV